MNSSFGEVKLPVDCRFSIVWITVWPDKERGLSGFVSCWCDVTYAFGPDFVRICPGRPASGEISRQTSKNLMNTRRKSNTRNQSVLTLTPFESGIRPRDFVSAAPGRG